MRTVTISMDVYLDLLRDRFEVTQDRWGSDASYSLFPLLLDLIEEKGVDPIHSEPSDIIDNYIVNGEFIDRREFEQGDYYSNYKDWDDVCDNAILYNDKYACIQF